MADKINTHEEACNIVELFDEVLAKYDIYVPSPEDDERDPDDMTGLYGSTYSDLFDAVEDYLIDLLAKHHPDTKLVMGVFE